MSAAANLQMGAASHIWRAERWPVPCHGSRPQQSSEAHGLRLRGINGKLTAARQYWSSSRNSCCRCSPVWILSVILPKPHIGCQLILHMQKNWLLFFFFSRWLFFVAGSLSWAIASCFWGLLWLSWQLDLISSSPAPGILSLVSSFQGWQKLYTILCHNRIQCCPPSPSPISCVWSSTEVGRGEKVWSSHAKPFCSSPCGRTHCLGAGYRCLILAVELHLTIQGKRKKNISSGAD